jgi:hypothetical protein
MALKGNLRDFSFSQLLNLINLARKSGVLTMTSEAEVTLSFREGKLIDACDSASEVTNLAQLLFQRGMLSQEHYDAIAARAAAMNDKQLGRLLIQAGFVNQTDILQSVRQNILDIVYDQFSRAEGAFRFEANAQPPATRLTIPIDLENVIMEGSRRIQEWERLLEEIPDLDISLRFADQPDARLRNVHLTVEEWRVVAFVNPQNSIRRIARAINLSDFEIRRIVFGLLQAGIVQEVARPKHQPVTSQAAQVADAGRQPDMRQASPTVKRSIVARLIERIKRL